MTEPQQFASSPGAAPTSYTEGEIAFLRLSWRLTPRLTTTLRHLLAWKIPKEISREMGITTKSVRNKVTLLCERARIHDGADGIKEAAAKWIARKRADPHLQPHVWWDEHERPEDRG